MWVNKVHPNQKADDLVSEMKFPCRECDFDTNACISANRLVDEIISDLKIRLDYWQMVKSEIDLIRTKDDIIVRPKITMDIKKFKSK
tara:strand:+ start:1476 stop:1736 length:261 start_codon:yes stop_codon:yes gene_type:complete